MMQAPIPEAVEIAPTPEPEAKVRPKPRTKNGGCVQRVNADSYQL